MFFWTAVLGACLGLTQLALITGLNRQWGLSDELFALGDSAILTVLGQVSFMPVLVLAARLCPEGVEATLFATLSELYESILARMSEGYYMCFSFFFGELYFMPSCTKVWIRCPL